MTQHTLQKVYIKTHGCQMNEYDSQKMRDVLHDAYGVTETDDPTEADIILFNTCSVREKAQEKVFSDLGRVREIKERKPHLIIGVGGCVASQEGEAIAKRAPYVDVVFGPQTLHRLPELIDSAIKTRKTAVDIRFPEIEKFDYLPEPKANGSTAFVSIMEGCNKYCSFCVVPYTRGTEISRPFDSVITEIVKLTEQGVREINLLGQNVNDYRGIMHDGTIADLALLIRYVAAIDGVKRIRFTTSHPAAFSQNLIDVFADEPKLVNHLHLPVQSGSDRILAAMKRNYTVLEYKSKIRALRKVRPSISISSDFIIGFPGETEKDFEDTMNLVAEIGFDFSFSFIYSRRPGTPAASLLDETPIAVKKERLAILQNRIDQHTAEMSRCLIGTDQKILVAHSATKSPNEMAGRTECNRMVNFKTVSGQYEPNLIGEIISVRIAGANRNFLSGKQETV
ncbi:MAG: tRNA (N6-isopentenyl adenosine(37)-C2)-methylthiotransferase MiaB [Gammaproteobacteria bacterium RIFCSPHIGHO2_02_FULL_39_13]|nr:MAG: tRNA (N6-isopentenyl adenosine(37)-C2)-methylthiotransferase MiaB [Gammaproteobacteria bacterium RIFCSPHIGHO2_02_FULL_39_13]OGT50170.1 MAG: tRNA (N6-isopentenyl adenosine(37)-C2)-methylthiotransferase MiaB [Gammaproteobacteria bacterium RIFCSPHIGHO2_12_FULL_39_24]